VFHLDNDHCKKIDRNPSWCYPCVPKPGANQWQQLTEISFDEITWVTLLHCSYFTCSVFQSTWTILWYNHFDGNFTNELLEFILSKMYLHIWTKMNALILSWLFHLNHRWSLRITIFYWFVLVMNDSNILFAIRWLSFLQPGTNQRRNAWC
jgi:hypothetical protein